LHALLQNKVLGEDIGEDIGPTSGLRRQCRQQKQLLDNLIEWSGKTVLVLVRIAENRLANQRFIHKVAHAPETNTAP